MSDGFDRASSRLAAFAGRPTMLGICAVLVELGIGAFFAGNDHLLNGANLLLSIVTLLLLPVLQASQNRDSLATQAKLDEIIAALEMARDSMIGVENRPSSDIEHLRRAE